MSYLNWLDYIYKCNFIENIGNKVIWMSLVGLMQSKKTTVMTTPKCLEVQIWQIYPPALTSCAQDECKFSRSTPRSAGRSTPLVLTSCGQDECKFGRSTFSSAGRSTPQKNNKNCNASWDIYYGMYLAAILDSSRKGGNFFLFLNNKGGKQSVSIVEWCHSVL